MVPLLIRKATLILALDIPRGILMTVVIEQIKTSLHAPDKTSRVLPAQTSVLIYLLSVHSSLLSQTSPIKRSF